jgi:hypothetical protein
LLEKESSIPTSEIALSELQMFWKENLLKELLCREEA